MKVKRLQLPILGCVLCAIALIFFSFNAGNEQDEKWFPYFDFDAAAFQKAPREFGPFTRWWLPGNDVTSEELKREVQMFADNGFAGVEVQPLTMGLNPNAPQTQKDRIYSWDSPSFYEHLGAIMQQAKESGIIVDMNGGSGWPLGGAFFDPKESMRTLAVSDTMLQSGQSFSGKLPKINHNAYKPTGMMAAIQQKLFVDDAWATIQSVIAAKVVKKAEKQTVLDPQSIVNLTDKVQNGNLSWQAPNNGSEWQIVVSWSIPSGEKPHLIASAKTSYVIDHLDPAIVNKTYAYLLGDRTGLPKYYGKPLRAVFNDSYEFLTDRITSPDFLEVFKKQNGYDIAPYLASIFKKGYNHPVYLAAMYPNAKPLVVFDEAENWRMMYDYDRTVNQVFQNNFIKTSNNWLRKNGMLHRTQAYGFPIDLIGSAGAADIPEAEQLFAEGSEGYLKLVTSGAHLYGRPVIAQESFVSIYRAEMTTPQKIKIWADKSLACGINQFIYHGTPYKYNNGEYGKEGWNTWSSPYVPFVNFSTGMNESDPFWKDIKAVNQYLTRCQYAMRAGKPTHDVLIYVPFVDFTEDQIANNPEEIMPKGHFKDIEVDIQGFGVFAAPDTPLHRWYKSIWKTINELESKGISWEFVNDDALQKASLENGKLTISGNQYQTLLLANLPYINLQTAKHLHTLSKQGLSLWAIGELPQKQPSYLNYKENDLLVKQLVTEAMQQKNSKTINAEISVNSLDLKVKFAQNVPFSRQITREMKDGSQIKFFWNKTNQWQTLSLVMDKNFKNSYFLNPENGAITKNKTNTIIYTLPPYGSVLLYASTTKAIDNKLLSTQSFYVSAAKDLLKIEKWNIKAGSAEVKDSPLFDWRTNEAFKYKSEEGNYTATFKLDKINPKARYWIDLGKVYYTAEVLVNGKSAGKCIFAPYQLDISKLVQNGDNHVEVRLTSTRLNSFIGEAKNGNPLYGQFKGKENTMTPSGLVGEVWIKMQ